MPGSSKVQEHYLSSHVFDDDARPADLLAGAQRDDLQLVEGSHAAQSAPKPHSRPRSVAAVGPSAAFPLLLQSPAAVEHGAAATGAATSDRRGRGAPEKEGGSLRHGGAHKLRLFGSRQD